jgi:D-alanyl-D-alanine carboxypeptidase
MKKSPHPKYLEQQDLIKIKDEGRSFQLHPDAFTAWKKMKDAARTVGISLYIVSAFRSFERQSEIIEQKRQKGVSKEEIFKVSAPPGFSEHHTGKAVDINTRGFSALEEDFEKSEAFKWLSRNAKNFGFHLSYPKENRFGMAYEPWHWFYDETTQKIDGNNAKHWAANKRLQHNNQIDV